MDLMILFVSGAATFAFIAWMVSYIAPFIMFKILGHPWVLDVPLHLLLFFGFLHLGVTAVIQAEIAGFMVSFWLRLLRRWRGYQRLEMRDVPVRLGKHKLGTVRTPGWVPYGNAVHS